MTILYLVYYYEFEQFMEKKNGSLVPFTINQGPVIVGLFDKVPDKFQEHKKKKIDVNITVPEKLLYVLFTFHAVTDTEVKLYGVYNDLSELNTEGYKDKCYGIFTTMVNKPYPYGKTPICWIKGYIFFQNLFISNNLDSLQKLEKMVKNNESLVLHELIH